MTARLAVLGCGRIGRMHAELLARRVDGAALVAVHDVVPEFAGAVAAELGVPALRTVGDVLAAGVDAVAICTSTDTHVDLITAAARAGVGVFCEKPISLDLAEVDAALGEITASGVLMHIGFNRRFDPAHRSVRDAVASGQLGRLDIVRVTSRDPSPPPIAYIERSGGLFLDMTIHDLDMARFITGTEVVEVAAHGGVRIDPAIGQVGDIDTAVVVLGHEDGCITVIDNSRQCAYGYDQRVEAFGSLGMAASDNPAVHSGIRRDALGGHQAAIPYFFLDRYVPSYVHQWEAFVAALASGGPAPVTGTDGRAALVLGLAARRSLELGGPVAVRDVESSVLSVEDRRIG